MHITMRVRLWTGLVLTFLSSLALGIETVRSVDIFAWPLSASKPQPLVQISYTPTNATVKSYTAPTIPVGDPVVRVGFKRAGGDWSGVSTAASLFVGNKSKRLQLHVKPDGELYHVGIKAGEGVSQTDSTNTREGLSVEVLSIPPGPAPLLNKPVVVNADGHPEEKEPEKSFFQKYWWAIALFVIMQLVAGGGGGSGGEGSGGKK